MLFEEMKIENENMLRNHSSHAKTKYCDVNVIIIKKSLLIFRSLCHKIWHENSSNVSYPDDEHDLYTQTPLRTFTRKKSINYELRNVDVHNRNGSQHVMWAGKKQLKHCIKMKFML